MFEKTENKRKRGRVWPVFKKNKQLRYPQLLLNSFIAFVPALEPMGETGVHLADGVGCAHGRPADPQLGVAVFSTWASI